MSYQPRLELRLSHAFYGPNPPPLQVKPANQAAFEAAGLMLRPDGPIWRIIGEPAQMPVSLALDLIANNAEMITVTQGLDWAFAPAFTLRGTGFFALSKMTPEQQHTRMENGKLSNRIARLNLTLPKTGTLKTNVTWSAVRGIWTYRVVAKDLPENLSVTDTAGQVTFHPLGEETLPDGRRVKLFRSATSIPAAKRAPERFRLQKTGPFGAPETLIETLPVAGANLTEPKPGTESAPHISDIYVTL